jgi:hypothetical protein
MLPMRRKIPVVLAALLTLVAFAHAGAEDVPPIRKGEPLAAALDGLRAQGLQLIFSSALIGPELRVEVDPGSGSPEDVARRILASHGLTLEAIRPGFFAVVKAGTSAQQTGVPGTSAERNAAAATAGANEALYEIDVYASRYKIESQPPPAALAELSREDIAALPGLNQDVLRVTHFLPGTASNALSARSHVRGGREDELAVFFDGVPLFEPFHYKDVQSLLGMLDPESISTVDFFSGVFPARYGNRLSGVLDIQPRTGAGENYNAIGASVLYSHALSQGHVDSWPLEWLASVRRGNVDLFADMIGRRETEPNFLDALGRLKLDLTPQMSLVGGWLLLDDELEADFTNGTELGDIEYRDATGWLSWRYRADGDLELRATASRTERHTNRNGSVDQPGNSQGSLDDRRRFDTTTLRLEASTRALSHVAITGGVEWYDYDAHYRYMSNASFDPALAAAFGRSATESRSTALVARGEAYAAYASTTGGIAPRTTLDVSLRWDAQRFGAAFSDDQFSPRVSLQYDYNPVTIFRLSWGRASQTARPDELQVPEGDTAFPAAQHETQIALSAERHLTPSALLRAEVYDKRVHDPSPSYENLLDPFALLPELEVDRVRIQPDRSHMHGAELSLRWQWPQTWSGWTSYSWSQATDDFGTTSVPRTWDQKHSLATGVQWSKGPWIVATNLTWHTGWRRNELVPTAAGLDLAPRNADHWPAYFSFDVRTGWRHSLRRGSLDAFFEIDNLTNHDNPCCSELRMSSAGAGSFSREETSWLPRLYLLGVTWQLP